MEPQSSQLIEPSRKQGEPSPLRVLLDGRKIGDGGIGTYIENLAIGLLDSAGVQLSIVATRERAERTSFFGEAQWIFDEAGGYSLDEMILMPRRIDFSAFDVFHTPHYMLPFGVPVPSVVTIHDLIHITHPERVYYPTVARWLIRSAARRASSIIAVSRDTQRAIVDLAHVSPSKVVHIPNAVPRSIAERSGAQKSACLKRYSDLAPYFLVVLSNVKPHKALPDLVSAFKAFREYKSDTWEGKLPRAPRLVITGFGTEQLLNSDDLLRLISDTAGIDVVGPVSSEDLAFLYSKALSVVIPSVAEGFCLPALESQSVGAPVVCRPVPALMELVTERDIVAHDMSVDAFTEALAERAARGCAVDRVVPEAHLARYSPLRIAQETIDVYQKVAAVSAAVRG